MINENKELILASPRGFCAGVVRAIETVILTLEQHGAPIYVLHEIVHNKHVISELEALGAIFVKELGEIPQGGVCVFSAHGVSVKIKEKAEILGLRTVNATCPLVTSVHRLVEKYFRDKYDIIIIGHHRHPEVEGTAGRIDGMVHIVANEDDAKGLEVENDKRVAYVTQTTLSQDDVVAIRDILVKRFPEIKSSSSNICYATQNRQSAVKELSKSIDLLLVVGSKNSSNSNRLKEVGVKSGIDSYLIDDKDDIDPGWFDGKRKIGLTAGASAPERLVGGVIEWMQDRWLVTLAEMEGEEKKVYFSPATLD